MTRQLSAPAVTAEHDGRLEWCSSLQRFDALAAQWTGLAAPGDSPFVTHPWLRAWWSAYASCEPRALLLRGEDGRLRAGAVLAAEPRRGLRSATNVYSEEWDAVAEDDRARAELWSAVAGTRTPRITLTGLPAASPSVALAERALTDRGFQVAVTPSQSSPRLALPGDWPTLLAGVSKNLRSQVGRFRTRLGREGSVAFRTATGPDLGDDLDRFLALEAAGWKGANGTAIRQDEQARQLYTDFARTSAAHGWLRLHLLELDGRLIGGDLTCVLGGGAFLLKTTYDESWAQLSPGLVLRAEALRSAVQEGLRFYDFLGGPDPYKVRWTPHLHERVVLHAYRGSGLPEYVWRHELRPAARAVVDRGRNGLRVAARASAALTSARKGR